MSVGEMAAHVALYVLALLYGSVMLAALFAAIRPGPLNNMQSGLLFRPTRWWVGIHWNTYNRRLCINLLPCVTVWLVLPGGKVPKHE